MTRRAGKRQQLKRLRKALKKLNETPTQQKQEADTPWRLTLIEIPEINWKTYKKTDKKDPRRKHARILKYFGNLAASPRNDEERCLCKFCSGKRTTTKESLEDKRLTQGEGCNIQQEEE
ncbi:uncharacterized protein LOC123989031 [Osmia bicornis bicornis]|uniref:uncharacterized protein LOC123989031 n=1 Tax=Osmia bicornis bicornis TaxID=1437191 RepID=UPI001EAECFF4|nr:uncharacterized protein LOC123989031 [Osmia bicornis bicornis]